MDAQQIFGTMTLVFGIAMVFIGLTAQAIKNHREKRCGNPLALAALALAVYLSRAAYAITISSFYILVPDVVGIVLSSIIIFQYYHYRR